MLHGITSRKLDWLSGLVLLVFCLFCWYGNGEYWLNYSVWKSIVDGISVALLEFVDVLSSSSIDCSSSRIESKDLIGLFIFESLLSLSSSFRWGFYCCIKGKRIGAFG